MFSDGLLPLLEKGVVTNQHKARQQGRTVASFIMGTRKLYDFVHDNPAVELRDCSYVNDTSVIRRHPRVTAINSAIEVDLTGQVVADSIGERIFSGVGGQMDFIRGATLSEGGKAIIALPSTTSKGESRICALLKPGGGVVTTRAHVHWVVTEHGAVDLRGKNLRQRAVALIGIADPAHREGLARAAREHRIDLHARRGHRHHDDRATAQPLRRERHALRVIAGRRRDHPPREFVGRQPRHLVVGAAQLEREHRLQVLALEQHGVAEALRQRFGAFERRFLGDVVDPRGQDALEVLSGHGGSILPSAAGGPRAAARMVPRRTPAAPRLAARWKP
jgi:hypothetical protein